MPLFDQLRGFLAEVQGEKKAAANKKAETLSEPGSIGGATSHPVKNVDDQLQTATEGARSSENSSDVKKQIPLAVDSASEKGPDQESQQFNIGVTSTETGNDSANEENYKDKKDDPGTTHPADVSDNEKYGSMSFNELKKLSEKKANDILATIAAAGQKAAGQQKAAAPARPTPAAPAKAPAAANPAPAQKAAATQAAAAGYQAAADAGTAGDEQEKVAVQAAVESTIRDALSAAVMTGNYLVEFRKQAGKKQAADDEDSSSSSSGDSEGGSSEGGESKSKSKSDSGGGDSGGGGEGGGGGAPADGGGGGGGGLGLDPAALGAMAGGGAGGGGDPMAGGGGGQEDAVNQLLMALMEMGVSPDEIMAALQGAGGGGGGSDPMAGLGGGGGDPMAGGGDPMAGLGGGDPMAGGDPLAAAGGGGDPMKMARIKQARQAQTVRRNLMQLVKSAKTYQRQGKFRFSEAKTAAERRLRDELKKCIAEIVN